MGAYQADPIISNQKRKRSIRDQVLRRSAWIFGLLILIIPVHLIAKVYYADGSRINKDRHAYILEKLQSHDIVLLGTTHKKRPILQFLSDLIPILHEAQVTHLGLEVCSDQQGAIDKFLQTGRGVADIELHYTMDCEEYRHIFTTLRRLDRRRRPSVIALDLPKRMYRGAMNRDEWMALSIARIFGEHPNAKVLLVVGNLHILKKIDWEETVPSPRGFIRSYLNEFTPRLHVFSIGQCIDQSPYTCDFTRVFSRLEGAVAMDCDDRFRDWKIGITRPVAAKPAQVFTLLDGVIVY